MTTEGDRSQLEDPTAGGIIKESDRFGQGLLSPEDISSLNLETEANIITAVQRTAKAFVQEYESEENTRVLYEAHVIGAKITLMSDRRRKEIVTRQVVVGIHHVPISKGGGKFERDSYVTAIPSVVLRERRMANPKLVYTNPDILPTVESGMAIRWEDIPLNDAEQTQAVIGGVIAAGIQETLKVNP